MRLLNRAASNISGKFGSQPQVEAAICSTIADAYLALGLFKEGRQQAERAVELRRPVLGQEHQDTLSSLATLGRVQSGSSAAGNTAEAAAIHREVLGVERRSPGAEASEHANDNAPAGEGLAAALRESVIMVQPSHYW